MLDFIFSWRYLRRVLFSETTPFSLAKFKDASEEKSPPSSESRIRKVTSKCVHDYWWAALFFSGCLGTENHRKVNKVNTYPKSKLHLNIYRINWNKQQQQLRLYFA
jgi:hypothetical protein